MTQYLLLTYPAKENRQGFLSYSLACQTISDGTDGTDAVVNHLVDHFDPVQAFTCPVHIRRRSEDGVINAELENQNIASYSNSKNSEDEHKPSRLGTPLLYSLRAFI